MPTPSNSIVVNANSGSKFLEAPAGEVIRPGNWLTRNGVGAFILNNEPAGTINNLIVAVEDISGGHDVDSSYEVGETVKARYLRGGDVFYGLLVAGQTLQIGEGLNLSSSPGYFQLATSITVATGDALEQKTTVGVPDFILIEAR